MRRFTSLCTGFALAACSTSHNLVETRKREVLFIVPEAVHANEPRADRISLLLGSGQVAVYRDATLRRDASRFVVEDATGTMMLRGAHEAVDVRAVQLERVTQVQTNVRAHQKDGVESNSTPLVVGGIVLALVLVVALAAN
jgi:hypothetical protein